MPAWLSEMLAAHLHRLGLTAVDRDAWGFVWPSGAHLSYSAWRKQWDLSRRKTVRHARRAHAQSQDGAVGPLAL